MSVTAWSNVSDLLGCPVWPAGVSHSAETFRPTSSLFSAMRIERVSSRWTCRTVLVARSSAISSSQRSTCSARSSRSR